MSRPAIPAAVKLELRQRCGFGCVICGSPVYDYEHLDGWENSGHNPERMTLLCPMHHREKTVGRLPVRQVERHNDSPFNGARSFTSGHPLFFDPTRPPHLVLGNVIFAPHEMAHPGHAVGIEVDQTMALGVRISATGHPIVDIDLRDLDDRPLLRAMQGQLRVSVKNWDVRFEGTRLLVRRGHRDPLIDVLFEPEQDRLRVQSADFALHHVRFRIGSNAPGGGVHLPDMEVTIQGGTFFGGGIVAGTGGASSAAFQLDAVRAYGAPLPPRGSSFRAQT